MNCRFLLVSVIAAVLVCSAAVDKGNKGTCGSYLVWELDEETNVFTISGKGKMTDKCNISWCHDIKSVVINEGALSIAAYAFRGWDKMESVKIPKSMDSIGLSAFAKCDSLTMIEIDKDNPRFTSIDGALYDKQETTLYVYPCGKGDNFTTPDFVQTVGKNAFSCESLKSVSFGDSVKRIYDDALDNCDRLESIYLGSNVKSIGTEFVNQCFHLMNFSVSEDNKAFKSFDGVLFDKTMSTLLYFPCGRTDNYTVPNSVSSIGDHAFEYSSLQFLSFGNDSILEDIGESSFEATHLLSITLPNTVKYIGPYAFYYSSFTSITIPDSVELIDNDAFGSCHDMVNVTIGNSVKKIASYAFSMCSVLTSVSIPDSVTTIETSAFWDDIQLESVTIGKSLSSLSVSVFEGCSNLRNITVDKSNRYFESVDGVLIDKIAKKIVKYPTSKENKNYTTPDGIRAIGDSAFAESIYLESVVIGEAVTSIGSYAFEECGNLTSVAYLGINDPKEGFSDPFSNCWKLSTICVRERYCCSSFCGRSYLSKLDKCGLSYNETSDSASSQIVPLITPMAITAVILSLFL